MGTVSQLENSAQAANVYEMQQSQQTKQSQQAKQKETASYGRTIGQPELSDKAKEYYAELKKKFSNLDFILVSKDMKEIAKSQAGSYANPHRLVVLIDEEKIERMAADENFRKYYESVISNASRGLNQFKQQLGNNASKVKSYGMLFNDGGNASFFAVVDKMLSDQKDRIKKRKEEKAEDKKEADRKAAKKDEEEKRAERLGGKVNDDGTITFTASSLEELARKINDYYYGGMSDMVETDAEKLVGHHIDFRG